MILIFFLIQLKNRKNLHFQQYFTIIYKFLILKDYHQMQEKCDTNISILIVARIYEQDEVFKMTKKIVQKFKDLIPTVFYFMDANTCNKVRQILSVKECKQFNRAQDADKINYVVTIGGDGTILYAAKQFLSTSPPFITFQKGTLGFLCKFAAEQYQNVIKKIVTIEQEKMKDRVDQIFQVTKLMRLTSNFKKISSEGISSYEKKVMLNQVAITRKDCNRIALQIYVNQQLLTTTSGDGILVSTPTGSTAYALSAGGPVVLNGVNSIILVPIAPNSLSFRPICLPSDSVIKIKMGKKSRSNILVNFDGQSSIQMEQNDEIQIKNESGNNSKDLVLYELKQSQKDERHQMPTWMMRLKHFLGWNQTFQSPSCSNLKKDIQKISLSQSMKEIKY